MITKEQELLQIVDQALAEAARKSGPWLVCHGGCTPCCYGPFPISGLDAWRLREGLAALQLTEPARAAQVVTRAAAYIAKVAADFPGDPRTGILSTTLEAEARFEDFANDEPCPALDLTTGLCDLYAARPMTCRTFGPAMQSDGESLGVCELCYHGASDKEIVNCEVELNIADAEAELNAGFPAEATIVAFALTL